MGWTSLILEMEDKKVLIAGSGEVGKRRAIRFLEAGAQVIVLGNHLPKELLDLGITLKPFNQAEEWIQWSDLVIVATSDSNLNQWLASFAGDKLLNRADKPLEGNTIIPASFFIGDVQICIFTQGKSPLMARELRKKIEDIIKEEDIRQIELQHFTRILLKDKVKDQKKRKYYLKQVLNDERINKLLKAGEIENAETLVNDLLNNPQN